MVLGIRQKKVDFNFQIYGRYIWFIVHCETLLEEFFQNKDSWIYVSFESSSLFPLMVTEYNKTPGTLKDSVFPFCRAHLSLPCTWYVHFQPYFLYSVSCTLIATLVTLSLLFKLQSICFLKAHLLLNFQYWSPIPKGWHFFLKFILF